MGGFPIPCWYVKDGYKPRVKALMLSVPSDRTLIVLESGDARARAYTFQSTGKGSSTARDA